MKYKTVKLGDICNLITDGVHAKPDYTLEGVPFVSVKDISKKKLNLSNTKFISQESHEKYIKRCKPEFEDILYTKVGTYGIASLVDTKEEFSLYVSVCLIKPKKELVDSKYLVHLLNSVIVERQADRLVRGIGVPDLHLIEIKKIKIPLPPLPEQKRIAEVLDCADALREKRRLALQKLDTLLQSVFLEMFGDPVKNPMGWKSCQLGSVCDVGSSKRVFVDELVETGIPFYRGTEIGKLGDNQLVNPSLFITKEHYERLKAETGVPQVGDLLLPSICPDGRIYLVKDENPFYFKDGRVLWIKIEGSHINSVFLRYHLKQLFFANYSKIASGTTFAELKIFALKALDIQVPPVELQDKFSNVVEKIELIKENKQYSLDRIENLFQSLQQKAFKGELFDNKRKEELFGSGSAA